MFYFFFFFHKFEFILQLLGGPLTYSSHLFLSVAAILVQAETRVKYTRAPNALSQVVCKKAHILFWFVFLR